MYGCVCVCVCGYAKCETGFFLIFISFVWNFVSVMEKKCSSIHFIVIEMRKKSHQHSVKTTSGIRISIRLTEACILCTDVCTNTLCYKVVHVLTTSSCVFGLLFASFTQLSLLPVVMVCVLYNALMRYVVGWTLDMNYTVIYAYALYWNLKNNICNDRHQFYSF